jgi:hypothetical protein
MNGTANLRAVPDTKPGEIGMALQMNKFVLGTAVATMVLASSTVTADTVHDQAAFDTNGYGWDSVTGESNQQIADDFRLKRSGKITNLRWTGKYHDSSAPGEKLFEVLVFADQYGKPGKILHSETVSARGWDTRVSDIGSHRMLSYNTSLTRSPVLDAGRTYWLSVRESDPTTKALWSWSFHKGNVAGGFSYRLGKSREWSVGSRDMAYALTVARPN